MIKFSKYKKKVFYIIFYIIIFFVYDAFTNTYIVLRENYSYRLTKNAGYCNLQGYGFYEFIDKNYSSKKNNIGAVNFNDMPTPSTYFFNYKKKESFNEIILIGADIDKISKYLEDDFKIIYSQYMCFYLKK